MKARLLHSFIAERVLADDTGPGAGWTVGLCGHCAARVWLWNPWVEMLVGDPQAIASCFECAHALVGDDG